MTKPSRRISDGVNDLQCEEDVRYLQASKQPGFGEIIQIYDVKYSSPNGEYSAAPDSYLIRRYAEVNLRYNGEIG